MTTPSSTADQNLATIYSYLKSMGATDIAAAGILGNMQVESGFSPTAYNPNEDAWGLSQWELGRLTALQSYATNLKEDFKSLTAQLGFFNDEVTSSYAGAWKQINTATTPQQAASIWDNQYEKSSGSTDAQRQANAAAIYSQIQAGQIPTVSVSNLPQSPSQPGPTSTSFNWQQFGTDIADASGVGLASSLLGGISGITDDVAKAVAVLTIPLSYVGDVFKDIAWIFNIDHFVKFELYLWGIVFLLVGLGMIVFGAGHGEPAGE